MVQALWQASAFGQAYCTIRGDAHMVTLVFALVLVCCIYPVYRLSTRTVPYRYFWSGFWRVACLIAAVRLSALWLGSAGLRRGRVAADSGILFVDA